MRTPNTVTEFVDDHDRNERPDETKTLTNNITDSLQLRLRS